MTNITFFDAFALLTSIPSEISSLSYSSYVAGILSIHAAGN